MYIYVYVYVYMCIEREMWKCCIDMDTVYILGIQSPLVPFHGLSLHPGLVGSLRDYLRAG